MGNGITLAACGLALAAASPLVAQSCTKRLLFVGDSITEGSWAHPSYRHDLWQQLRFAPCGVDLVGPKNGITGKPPPATPAFDMDHFAFWGATTFDVIFQVLALPTPLTADVVLIELGINDIRVTFEAGGDENAAAANVDLGLRALIPMLNAISPGLPIRVAKILPATLPAIAQSKTNLAIQLANNNIALLNQTWNNVVAIDVSANYTTANTYDGVHPDASGEAILATNWTTALAPLLAAPSSSAAYQHYGRACGLPRRLDFSGPAVAGAALTAVFSNMQPNDSVFGIVALGLGETALGPSPADCYSLLDSATSSSTFLGSPPNLTWGITIPSTGFLGVQLFWQLVGVDAQNNAWVSDGGWMRVGT